MENYAIAKTAKPDKSLYLLSGNTKPHRRKTFWTTAGTSLLLWTLVTNALLIVSMILALQTEDLEFIKAAYITLPLLAVTINILDYKSILPTFIANRPKEKIAINNKINTSRIFRLLPILLIAPWVAAMIVL